MAQLCGLLLIAVAPTLASAGAVRYKQPGAYTPPEWLTTSPLPATPLFTTMEPGTAPRSGAAFEFDIPLMAAQPSPTEDKSNTEMMITRLEYKSDEVEKDSASPHACTDKDEPEQADKHKCLNVEGRSCMWTRVESRDPLKRIQTSSAYCLPCRMDGQAIPCWNIGAWVGGKQVTECEMSCSHQQKVMQQNYVCSDETGTISQSQCLAKGTATGSRCMFIAYQVNGGAKGSCAPCELPGTGGWGCPTKGAAGPEPGSKVESCLSQCDVLCTGPPACPPTVAPPPPPPPPAPGISKQAGPADEMVSAPIPGMAFPTINPWSIIESAREAAVKAGMPVATPTPLPKVYWPVVYYRSPDDYLYTTGPPPLDGPEPPLPIATSLLEADQRRSFETPLRRLRRR